MNCNEMESNESRCDLFQVNPKKKKKRCFGAQMVLLIILASQEVRVALGYYQIPQQSASISK